MNFIELWKISPVWFKVDLVIIHIASLYTAIRILLPAIKWVKQKVKAMCWWFDPEGRIIWFRFKPQVSLAKRPILSVTSRSDGRKKWEIRMSLLLKGNDPKTSEVTLRDFYMSIEQGWGKRKAKVKLSPVFANFCDETISLKKEQVTKEIILESFTKPNIPESDIDLSKSLKWKAVGIIGKVSGVHSKFLSPFRGHKGDIQIES